MLLDVQMRLVLPRAQGVPEGAVPPEDAAAAFSDTLTGHVLLLWDEEALKPIGDGLRRLGIDYPFPTGYGTRHYLHRLAVSWRGAIDPRTGRQRALIPPGRADRMLHLLRQITIPDAQYLGEADASTRRGTDGP